MKGFFSKSEKHVHFSDTFQLEIMMANHRKNNNISSASIYLQSLGYLLMYLHILIHTTHQSIFFVLLFDLKSFQKVVQKRRLSLQKWTSKLFFLKSMAVTSCCIGSIKFVIMRGKFEKKNLWEKILQILHGLSHFLESIAVCWQSHPRSE